MNRPSGGEQAARKREAMALLETNPYRTPWWLAGKHRQSFWGPMCHRQARPPVRHERLETPDDDFLDLFHLDARPDAPRVLLLHGLEGNAGSFYVPAFNWRFHSIGWNVTTMVYRTCGEEMNRGPRAYHMGETGDLDQVVRTLLHREPQGPLYLIGVSLGGNVLCKWLGEREEAVPEQVRAAAAISTPFDPSVSAPAFHKALFGFYVWHFLRTMIPKALAKAEQYPGLIDVDAVRNCRDFYVYDTEVTARLHGFEDAEAYWRKVGSHQYLPAVRVPTLLVSSADDPFNPPETLPRDTAAQSPWLHPQWTDHGGHVGFVMGPPWRPRYWAEEQTQRFFEFYHRIEQDAGQAETASAPLGVRATPPAAG